MVLHGATTASRKRSSAMAVLASRKSAVAAATTNIKRRRDIIPHKASATSTHREMKRRSMLCVDFQSAALAQVPRKRPRTSWGKPHTNPAQLLVCPSLFSKLEEAVSSSTSACEDEDCAASKCNNQLMTAPVSPGEATSFVKTEPLQHLVSVKLEELESYDDGPLHHLVPTFSPACMAEALLTFTPNGISARYVGHQYWAQQPSSVSRPLSPLHSSSASDGISAGPLSSSVTDEFSCDDSVQQRQLYWDHAFQEESCDFLSERFYELEKDVSCVIGVGTGQQHMVLHLHHHHSHPHYEELFGERKDSQAAGFGTEAVNVAEGDGHSQSVATSTESSVRLQEPKEEDQQQQQQPTVNSDCAALPEEEYRIDLVDFEPEAGVEVGEPDQQQLHEVSNYYYNKVHMRGGAGEEAVQDLGRKKVKVALSLDYEEVLSAWSNKGSLFTDGSSTTSASSPSSPDDYPLDLAAWEPAALSMQRWIFPQEASKMIMISPPDDGTCVGDDPDADADADGAGTSSSARHARVLRYREKRRNRLFSKKIRYEVRKLNAERRPRMKGRFIKRSTE